MCLADGADECDLYNERMQKSRKEYKCCECSRIIRNGEHYQYVFGVWEGSYSHYRTCQHCVVAQKWLQKECGSWLFGGVLDDLEEHLYGDKMFVYRLVVGMRRRWKKFKSNELMKVVNE